MLIYGITGGIGSGKSTVAGLLKQSGFVVFDADAIGRELLEKGATLTQEVLKHFPTAGLPDGSVDRRRLGELVFADAKARQALEGLMHPPIWKELFARIAALQPQPWLCFLEAALLADCEVPVKLAGLLLVTAPLSIRISRVCRRDGVSQEQALARIWAQSSDEYKTRKATHIVDNEGSLDNTKQQVQDIIRLIALDRGRQDG
jgi:dephospho-CoA kinase